MFASDENGGRARCTTPGLRDAAAETHHLLLRMGLALRGVSR